MSAATEILAWGLVQWKDAYQSAGQLDMMYDMLKWPLDYFLECWQPTRNEYYVQVCLNMRTLMKRCKRFGDTESKTYHRRVGFHMAYT